jgi:hypothetical protein
MPRGSRVHRRPTLSRWLAALLAAVLAMSAMPAWAAVQITFYSKELGSSFPHSFIIMEGTLDRTGERIAEDYGFTAKSVSPAILLGSVKGEVVSDHSPSYVRNSDRHFTLTITDAQYDQVMAIVGRWRTMAQPSYDLGSRNCIHFVAQIAAGIGMQADTPKRLMKKPRSYLEYLTEANRSWLQTRGATIHRGQGGPAPKARAG